MRQAGAKKNTFCPRGGAPIKSSLDAEQLNTLRLQREESEALMGPTDTKRITFGGAGVGK